MKLRTTGYLNFIIAIFDVIIISFSYFFLKQNSTQENGFPTDFFFLSFTIWLISAIIFNIYEDQTILDYEKMQRNTVRAFLFFTLLLVFLIYFNLQKLYSHIFILILAIGISIFIARLLFILLLYYLKNKGILRSKVAITSESNVLSNEFYKYLQNSKQYDVVNLTGDSNIHFLNCEDEKMVSGKIEDFVKICEENGVEEIFVLGCESTIGKWIQLVQFAELNFIKVKLVYSSKDLFLHNFKIKYIGDYPVFQLKYRNLDFLFNRIKKRLFDILFSIGIIILFFWLGIILAVIIKLSSRGPVFFIQKRSGKNNKTFNCIKFRSMIVNSESDILQATKFDLRLTKIGRFMRKTNLDELPQFFNVLKGEMSVVGPRPHMLKHTQQYSQLISHYMLRHAIKPGITGWAQVNGFRGETKELVEMENRVKCDIWYLDNWSFYLDIRIIIKTIFSIGIDRNAY